MYTNYALGSNEFRIRMSPDMALGISLNAVTPEDESKSEVVEIVRDRVPPPNEMDAYERVLGDAMAGDQTLFAREDYVEEAWRIVDPALHSGTPVYPYEPKTWGPAQAQQIAPPGGWHDPVL